VGSHLLGALPSVGTRWPAHATSTGKVLLAHLSEETLESRLAAPLTAATPRTVVDRAALRRELARVRERGYAFNNEELELGFVAVGAPVRDAGGRVVAALSVGGPRSRLVPDRLQDIAQRLPRSAARVAQRLGFVESRSRAVVTAAARKGSR
jgi:IclR family transcriptional regulator, acetate operon repressor